MQFLPHHWVPDLCRWPRPRWLRLDENGFLLRFDMRQYLLHTIKVANQLLWTKVEVQESTLKGRDGGEKVWRLAITCPKQICPISAPNPCPDSRNYRVRMEGKRNETFALLRQKKPASIRSRRPALPIADCRSPCGLVWFGDTSATSFSMKKVEYICPASTDSLIMISCSCCTTPNVNAPPPALVLLTSRRRSSSESTKAMWMR